MNTVLPIERDLLRFSTAGSVDDGKSTLIGRLLFDTQAIFEDQLSALEKRSIKKQEEELNLALLTDGLAAEREQGITIDVAYRYFSTAQRKFIIADTPGHEQYTRNMVTGASTADLALVLVDARKGLLIQSRRHAFIAHLLGISHLLICVNKMDLVDYDLAVFQNIEADFRKFAAPLKIPDLRFVPISALKGDNVVKKSDAMPGYAGLPLLETLETISVMRRPEGEAFRFPVQLVLRPHADYRGYAGRIAGGTVRVGDPIVALPSGRESRVRSIDQFDGALQEAKSGASVVMTLEDEIDVSRGDTLVHPEHVPVVAQAIEATLCWMTEAPLTLGKKYVIKHGTRLTRAIIEKVEARISIETLKEEVAQTLALNEIGRVTLKTLQPLVCDRYEKNRSTGSFILIDELSNATVAAGMVA